MCEIKRSGRARPSESESPQIKHTSGHVRQSHDPFWQAQRRRGKGESHRRTAITCDPVCVYDLLCWRRPLISNIHIAQNLFTFLQAAPSCPPSSASTSHPSTRYTLLFFRPPALSSGWGIMRSSASPPYTPRGATVYVRMFVTFGGGKEVVAALSSMCTTAASGQSM